MIRMRLGEPIRNRVRRRSAFTLIEMMVVLVLIAILSAMVIPEMKGTFGDALLRSNARELLDVMQLASSRAVSLNQTVRVVLDPASGHYQVERLKREGLAEDFVPLTDVLHSAGKLDKRIIIEIHSPDEMMSASQAGQPSGAMPPTDLVFNPDGTAANALIILKDHAGFRLALRINAITSQVTISESPHE